MSTNEKLLLDLTWQSDGHVSDVALSTLADGEVALLTDDVERHVEGCDECSMRLGEAALRSLQATESLPALAASLAATAHGVAVVPIASPVVRPMTRPLPVRAIVAALLVAIVGIVPELVQALPRLPDLMTTVVRLLPVLGRTAFSLLKGGVSKPLGITPTASWLAALLFLVAGIALARTMSRARSLQGELV